MNEDHANSILAYAQHFGQCRDATVATLIDVTANDMTLKVFVANDEKEINIPFDHSLKSGHDTHITLVKMSKAAKKSLDAL